MEINTQLIDTGLVEPLTPREGDVLRLLAQHLRYQDIAEQLTMAISSIKWYAQQIYGKLGVDNRRDAIQRAQELGLLEPHLVVSSPPDHKPQHNLPRQLTRFIGREKEIGRVVELIHQNPLVTLTGSGGVGKTRLAQVAAGELVESYASGIWLVELASLADEKLLPQTVAAIFGLHEQSSTSLLVVLTNYLREKQLLLVLDNCEHLIGACAQLVDHLLKSCARLSVLATSREALGVSGEVIFRVPSLSLPKDKDQPDPQNLLQFEAVSLFIDRAGRSRAGFELNSANALAVAKICRRLDGIPLAIELASARVEVMGVDQLATRLGDAFHLLTGGSRTALPRQQTIFASINWSYSLLSDLERILLNRLSVFTGGWTLAAAEHVCGFDEMATGQVLDLLLSLVNKSLVVVDTREEETRYSLLETIRQYAQNKLEGAVRVNLAERHLDYFCRFAEQAEPHLRAKDQRLWMDRVERDLDNIRASLAYSIPQRPIQGLGLASSLMWFWHVRGYRWEAVGWFERLLAGVVEIENTPVQTADASLQSILAKGFFSAGLVANIPYSTTQGSAWLKKARSRYQQMGPSGGFGISLCDTYLMPSDPDDYLKLLVDAEKIVAGKGDRFYLSEVYELLGHTLLYKKGMPAKAMPYLEKSLTIRRELDDIEGIGFICYMVGDIYQYTGNYSEALKSYQESFRNFQEAGSRTFPGEVLDEMIFLSLKQGKLDEAAQLIDQQAQLGQVMGDKRAMISNYLSRILMAYSRNDFETMARYCQQVLPKCVELGDEGSLFRVKLWLCVIAWKEGRDAEANALMHETIIPWLSTYTPVMSYDFYAFLLPNAAVRLVDRQEYYMGVLAFGLSMQSHGWFKVDQLPGEVDRYNKAISTARSALGEVVFQKAWADLSQDALETMERILDVLK